MQEMRQKKHMPTFQGVTDSRISTNCQNVKKVDNLCRGAHIRSAVTSDAPN
jgi:hypothetical protein